MSQMVTTVIPMDTPEALSRQIATEVRTAMETAGLSQRDVADATTIPLVTLNRRLVGGGKPFDLVELANVAGVLKLSVTELVLRAERNLTKVAA